MNEKKNEKTPERDDCCETNLDNPDVHSFGEQKPCALRKKEDDAAEPDETEKDEQ